jgi:hypothetical protein
MLYEISEGNHSTPLFPNTGNGDVGNMAYAWLETFLKGSGCYTNMLNSNAFNQNLSASKHQTNLN